MFLLENCTPSQIGRWAFAILSSAGFAFQLSGCSTIPSSGPGTRSVVAAAGGEAGTAEPPVRLVDVNGAWSRRLADATQPQSFATLLGDAPPYGSVVGSGDVLDISVWEAPPAVLFGAPLSQGRATEDLAVGKAVSFPEQSVDQNGMITMPFAGAVKAVGLTPAAIAQEIRRRLSSKAHDPQVMVRIVRNSAANVTVIGDVANSLRLPLTTKGERLLDALASAGGIRQPVNKMTIQISRGNVVAAMPLSAIVSNPRENIRLAASDIVTALFQPYSFTVLGASKRNEEIPFEATGLTLSQALGRMGGLDDQRANPKGVFIFRFEDPRLFKEDGAPAVSVTADGKVPVIYRVDMKDPKTLFVAQTFPVKDKDVVYITNAPLADFSKFLQAVSQIVYPISTIQNTNIF